MSLFASRRGMEPSQNGRPVLSIEQFFNAYIQRSDLLKFADHGRLEDVEEMQSYFEEVKAYGKYRYTKSVRKDKGGLRYKYIDFLGGNGPTGCKVVLIGKMEQFIIDYHQTKFTIDFTLEELIAEAEKK